MANDPRKYCPVKGQDETKKKADFFGSLKKVGGLEIFNDVGMGSVGEGLRSITATADVLRLGGSDSGIPDKVNQGATWVLDKVGVDGASFNELTNFRPDVTNRAVDQAKQIWRKAKDGNFSVRDIPFYAADLQNAVNLTKSIFPGFHKKGGAPGREDPEMCDPSPYAMDLIAFAPKFKYLFIVDIEYSEPYKESWQWPAKHMAFVVQTSTRPKFDVEHEEINMYNFHTQVPKRTIYQPMTMTFFDDNKNNAQLFYTSYMRAISPISNVKGNMFGGTTNQYQETSMDYNNPNQTATFDNVLNMNNQYAASLGPLLDNKTSIINSIQLFHVFGYGAMMNAYNFSNPKITSLELDELDMKESGPTHLTMDFAYDKLFVDTGIDLSQDEEFKRLEGRTLNGNFPLSPVFGTDPDPKQSQPNAPSAQQQDQGGIRGALASAERFVNSAINETNNITEGIYNRANEVVGDFVTTLKDSVDNTANNAIKPSPEIDNDKLV